MSEYSYDPSSQAPSENPYDDPELIALSGDDEQLLARFVAVKLAKARLEQAKAELTQYQIDNHYLPAADLEES